MAGPISKPDTANGLFHNIKQADDAMLALMRAGFAVFNPMLSVYCGGARYDGSGVVGSAHRQANAGFRDLSHQDWLDMDFAWVEVCHAVLRLPGESKGADMETEFATSRGIPVFHSIDDLMAHYSDPG